MSIRAHFNPRRADQRVIFERNAGTQDENGDTPADWRTLIECSAAVDGAKASSPEPNVGGGIKSSRDYTVWVRADIISRFSITEVDRVNWKGRILNIKDMPDQQIAGRWIAVICDSGKNAG